MEIKLYKNLSENNVIGKTLTQIKSVEANLKNDVSVINPTLVLNYTVNILESNYCFIPKFNRDFQSWCDEGDRIWKIYRDKIKNYFEKHPQEKLIYFQDRVCSDEHIIYDNKEKTKYHIEEL